LRAKELWGVSSTGQDWPAIRSRAALFPEEAFEFVREGLRFTADRLHGSAEDPDQQPEERRHVSGQQLCLGLRDLAVQRYGMLARTVLGRWGISKTDDFGTLVFAMIDRQELRASENDSFEDFKGVFDFAEAFVEPLTVG
jgi:uncharacterized repeat protein (TIGR04138 family)